MGGKGGGGKQGEVALTKHLLMARNASVLLAGDNLEGRGRPLQGKKKKRRTAGGISSKGLNVKHIQKDLIRRGGGTM